MTTNDPEEVVKIVSDVFNNTIMVIQNSLAKLWNVAHDIGYAEGYKQATLDLNSNLYKN